MGDLQVAKVGCGESPTYLFDSGANYSVSAPVCRWGSFFVQPYGLNNLILAENSYFDGSTYTRASSGYAAGLQFYVGQVLFWGTPSGSGSFTYTIAGKTDSAGNVALGGNVNYVEGSFTGARIVVLAQGNVSLDLQEGNPRIRNARTPASASATGNTGEICWDASYVYVCTATNTWRRIAHSTW